MSGNNCWNRVCFSCCWKAYNEIGWRDIVRQPVPDMWLIWQETEQYGGILYELIVSLYLMVEKKKKRAKTFQCPVFHFRSVHFRPSFSSPSKSSPAISAIPKEDNNKIDKNYITYIQRIRWPIDVYLSNQIKSGLFQATWPIKLVEKQWI